MSRPRFFLRIIIILGFVLVGASIGVYFQALRITEKPQEFRSLARLMVEGAASRKDTSREELNDLYGTIMEVVESGDMKRRALERVRALHPELEDSDVQIRASRGKDSGTINILAVGEEPRYTRIFLDALLDEFMAFRQSIREQGHGKGMNDYLQAVVNAQKGMEDALERMEHARTKVEAPAARAEHERLAARLASLRTQRDDLRLELKTGGTSRTPLEAKLSVLEQEVGSVETLTKQHDADAAEFRIASEKFLLAKEHYEKMFAATQDFLNQSSKDTNSVAIQERAGVAAEHVEDWVLPIAIGGGAGGLLGALAGILMTAALSGAATPPPAPPRPH